MRHDRRHIIDQIGMFAFTGMDAAMCDRLTDEHDIFFTRDGRISVAGVNSGIDYIAAAVHDVTKGTDRRVKGQLKLFKARGNPHHRLLVVAPRVCARHESHLELTAKRAYSVESHARIWPIASARSSTMRGPPPPSVRLARSRRGRPGHPAAVRSGVLVQ